MIWAWRSELRDMGFLVLATKQGWQIHREAKPCSGYQCTGQLYDLGFIMINMSLALSSLKPKLLVLSIVKLIMCIVLLLMAVKLDIILKHWQLISRPQDLANSCPCGSVQSAFTWQFRPGRKIVADLLSRHPTFTANLLLAADAISILAWTLLRSLLWMELLHIPFESLQETKHTQQ